MSGILYVVATPIGNLEDMTYRAVRILGEVSLVAAEDTRHSRKLLEHFGIKTRLISCHEHNEAGRSAELIERLGSGEDIALISDAGTPCIADPGYRLVRRCRELGLRVETVPGCNALIAGLSISGLPTDSFRFVGFLPAKKTARCKMMEQLCSADHTLVFYETPHRLRSALEDLKEICGAEREIAIGRELTKRHEELFFGPLGEAVAYFARKPVKGELVLMLAPGEREVPQESAEEALLRLKGAGLSWKDAVKQVARDHRLPKTQVYRLALDLRDK